MADNTTDSDVDAFMLATDKAGMRAAMDLGTAATTAAMDYATAAQGTLADSATQPGDLGNVAGLDIGTTAGTAAAGDDSRFTNARAPTAHASTHVNGADNIQDATASQKGLATAAQITKLDGIEAAADVTDAANVAAVLAAADTKSPPIDADVLPFLNSEGSFELAKFTLANLKAFLKTYFDTLYQAVGSYLTSGGALGTPSSGTLTNCTGLPTAGLVDDAVTLTKMAAGTAGNLITFDASGNPAAVATGTAGQVLTSNGAGAAPTMQTPSGGSGVDVMVVATKNGTDQTDTYSPNVYITVTFGTEVQDDGGDFASSTLTVASGEVWLITGAVSSSPTGSAHAHMLALFKDGTIEKKLNVASGYSVPYVTQNFATIVSSAGDYTIRQAFSGGASRTIEGDATDTYLICRRLK